MGAREAREDSFSYDAAGRMASRIVGGVETHLVWDVSSNLVETESARGRVVYECDGSGQRVVRVRLADAASGVMQPASVADAEAAVCTAYTPYGELRGVGNAEIDRGWLGQVEDAGTGLTYLNARYYDPVLQRFLSPDPLMDPGDPPTLDAYCYADNNPIVFTDANGLRPACASGGTIDQDACFYGAKGVELNPILKDPFGGSGNREYDRGGNAPKRPHTPGRSTGDWLFIPKLAVNFLGGLLNFGVSTANGAIWVAFTPTSGPPPPIPSVPIWDGDSPERGAFYYWASYTGSGTGGLLSFKLPLPGKGSRAALGGEASSGPGTWASPSESTSSRAAAYQSKITGAAPDSVYTVNGVKLDGFANGILQEAKGPGYANFVNKYGELKPWFTGDLLGQAERQIAAARGTPITWSVAEADAVTAIDNLFAREGITGIRVVHAPVG